MHPPPQFVFRSIWPWGAEKGAGAQSAETVPDLMNSKFQKMIF